MSHYELTEAENRLLERGLMFIPSRKKVDISKLLADLREWERRMRLKEYFYEDSDHTIHGQDEMNYTTKTTKAREMNKVFMPPSGRDLNLDLYIDIVKEDIYLRAPY